MPIDIKNALPEGGFLGNWLKYTEAFEFADSYGVFALFACAAAAIDRRIVVNPDTEPSPYTNIYVVLYGPSGARKGAAMKYALRLMGNAMQGEVTVLPRSFTFERLMSRLAKDTLDYGKCGGLVFSDEFQRLVGGRDYQSENLGFLTELYGCPGYWDRETHAHELEVLQNAYVNILASLPTEGAFKIDPTVLDAGGLRRTLIVCEYRAKRFTSKPRIDTNLALALESIFHENLGPEAFPTDTKMVLTKEAEEFMDHWYLTSVRNGLNNCTERESHFISCVQEHALKLGALYHLLEGGNPTELTRFSFEVGTKLVEAIMPEMFKMYAALVNTPFARIRGGIMRSLAGRSAEEGMDCGELVKNIVNTTGAKPKEVYEAIQSLVHEGTIMSEGNTVRVP